MTPKPTGRLLVVDDEAPLMTALGHTLRDEGYAVTGVTSGAEAIAALSRGPFDLIMTDLMMPQMDGITLLTEALVIDPGLAVIVMTGHGSIPSAVSAMKAGAIDYILKPFKLSVMLPVLERALLIRGLRVKNAALERRVRQRTTELEMANQELEAFCSSVSHDLRTPLRTIAGFVEILRGRPAAGLPPEVRRLVDLIDQGTTEMGALIAGLLDLSRLGLHALTRTSLEMAPLCEEVFQALKSDCAERQIELRLQPLPAAYADAALLRVVLTNLLSNAIKYTRPRAQALIEIGVEPEEDDGTPAYFVRDNGVGFDLNDADKLFGTFQRLHHAHEFEGTGVGLATVRRIVERHGGRVWADAVPGAGATFYFTLPMPEV
jgi:two-component system sensor histidine kinase/response regulator